MDPVHLQGESGIIIGILKYFKVSSNIPRCNPLSLLRQKAMLPVFGCKCVVASSTSSAAVGLVCITPVTPREGNL